MDLDPLNPDTLSPGWHRAWAEFLAIRKKQDATDAKLREVEALKLAEEANLRRAEAANEMEECGCCCTEYPQNRMVRCENSDPSVNHWLCYACVKTYVESQLGLMQHELVCIHLDGCSATFSMSQLRLAVSPRSIAKLEQYRQQAEIRLAVENGTLDELEECPFCDFKAIVPTSVQEDREFRCANDSCGIVSCRLCKLETHIPLSCEEQAKERGLDARHIVEEAMTEALVRTCNKCKNKFVKDYGCNKMTCPTCGTHMCYVCKQTVTNYNHFSDSHRPAIPGASGPKKCPLHDDVEARHDADVKKAEEEAMRKVREENPDLSEEELKLQVSDAVKKAELNRRNARVGPPHPGPFLGIGLNGPVAGFQRPLQHVRRRVGQDEYLRQRILAQQRRNIAMRAQLQPPVPVPAGTGVLAAYQNALMPPMPYHPLQGPANMPYLPQQGPGNLQYRPMHNVPQPFRGPYADQFMHYQNQFAAQEPPYQVNAEQRGAPGFANVDAAATGNQPSGEPAQQVDPARVHRPADSPEGGNQHPELNVQVEHDPNATLPQQLLAQGQPPNAPRVQADRNDPRFARPENLRNLYHMGEAERAHFTPLLTRAWEAFDNSKDRPTSPQHRAAIASLTNLTAVIGQVSARAARELILQQQGHLPPPQAYMNAHFNQPLPFLPQMAPGIHGQQQQQPDNDFDRFWSPEPAAYNANPPQVIPNNWQGIPYQMPPNVPNQAPDMGNAQPLHNTMNNYNMNFATPGAGANPNAPGWFNPYRPGPQ